MKWFSKIAVACTVVCCLVTFLPKASQAATRAASKQSIETKINNILKQMTLDEKLDLLTGTGYGTKAIPRLGIPAVDMSDGPQGVRGGKSTAFPAGICMASTWNTDLIQKLGGAIGRETIAKEGGGDIILGPCVNIHRTPLGGRNCESFSEDPYLAAGMAVAYIKGVQSQGAAACVKHYACNNQEYERGSINVKVDERALREIYLPAFRAATQEANVWSLMTSYNCINGPHATANKYLVTDILKNEWGWDGLVMSDWGAVHETAGVLNAGNDLEMPGNEYFTREKLHDALNKGEIKISTVDESVKRVLRCIARMGLLNGTKKNRDHSILNCDANRQIAQQVASEGIVLLKNDSSVLPIDKNKVKSIAVIGPYAQILQSSVWGSGQIDPVSPISPLDGIRKQTGNSIKINYADGIKLTQGFQLLPVVPETNLRSSESPDSEPGFRGEYFANKNCEGIPVLTRIDKTINFDWGTGASAENMPIDNFSVRWTGYLTVPESGTYKFELYSDDGSRLYIDDKLVVDNWGDHAAQMKTDKINLQAGMNHKIRLEYYDSIGAANVRLGWKTPSANISGPSIKEAIETAKKSDVAVIFAGISGVATGIEGEGTDRPDFDLPGDQNELIKGVSAVNKNTIVVLFGGTASDLTGWVNQVPSILEAWYPGVMGGDAIADLLFGKVNPSGKLPDTFGQHREDYPDYNNYPGANGEVKYAEGIFVGYRHFDKAGISPLFPFGYGLSYTTFKYSNIRFDKSAMLRGGKVKASVTLTNTGKRAGAEVAQLYVGELNPTVERPVRELKGFKKVFLNPGQSKTVSFNIDESALCFYNVAAKKWTANSGEYEISVGSSSRDLPLKKILKLK